MVGDTTTYQHERDMTHVDPSSYDTILWILVPLDTT